MTEHLEEKVSLEQLAYEKELTCRYCIKSLHKYMEILLILT